MALAVTALLLAAQGCTDLHELRTGAYKEKGGIRYYIAATRAKRWKIGENPYPQREIEWTIDER